MTFNQKCNVAKINKA